MFFGKKGIDRDFVLELFMITVCIMLGLRISSLNLLALGLSVWMIMFDRGLDHIFDLVFYLIPFSPIFKLDLKGFALFNIVTIVILVRLLMANNWTFSFPSISSFCIICYVFAGLRNAGLPDCIRFACQILIGSIVMVNPQFRDSFSIKRKNTMMVLGIIVSSMIAIMRNFFPKLAKMYELQGTRIKLGPGSYYYRFMGIETNPNMYTVLLSIAISVYLVYLIQGKLNKFDLVLIAFLLLFGAMTVSMSFIMSVAMMVALAAPILAKKNPKMMLCSTVVGIFGMILVIGLFGDSGALQTILFRLQSNSSESTDLSSFTTGRSDIWNLYFGFFFQHPIATLFGWGLNAKLPFRAPHNYYIETVYYLGIIGSILYIVAHADIYGPSQYTHKKCTLYQHFPLIMLLIRGMARCLVCNEKMLCIFLIYTLTAIDTSAETEPVYTQKIHRRRWVSP